MLFLTGGLPWGLILTLIVGVLSLIYWQSWRRKNKRMLELASKLPGPPALPIIGNAMLCMVGPEKLLHKISDATLPYGDYCRLWLGPDLLVFVKNPTDIRLLLTGNTVSEKGPLYKILTRFLGPGILTGGPTWRYHRKLATPAYSKKYVQHFTTVFNEEALNLVKVLSKKDPNTTFNVYLDVLEFTTQCTCQTLMGLSKGDSQKLRRLREVMYKTHSIYTLCFQKITRWFYHVPLIFKLIGLQKMEDYYAMCTEDLAADIVDKRKKALAEQNITSISDKDEDKMGVVDRFILSGNLTEQEIKWESITLFTTSQEAGAKMASAVLLFLAHLPEWQVKVYKEIIEVLGPDDSFVTASDVKKLIYLDAVYKEVLRYISIAAFIQRTVTEEVTLTDGKTTLPVGTSVVFPIQELHRDERFWPEPNKVKPERFLPENMQERDPNAFIPFSLGPMDCLGRVFATAMIKIMVVRVLRQIMLEADGKLEDLELHVAISVRFAKGYNLRARRRSTDQNTMKVPLTIGEIK